MDLQAGDIAFSGKYSPNFYDRVVMWATKSRWSHCFSIIGSIFGDLSVIEADLDVTMVSFQAQYIDQKNDYYEIYRPLTATPEQILTAGKFCYETYAEMSYGFLQPLWFLARSLMARVGIKLKKPWFSSGVVCSGMLFYYLQALGGDYAAMVSGYTYDTVDPEQLYQMVLARKDLFQFIGDRK